MVSDLKIYLCSLKLVDLLPTVSVDIIIHNDTTNLLFKNISHSLARERGVKMKFTSLSCEVPSKGRRICLDAICNKQLCERKGRSSHNICFANLNNLAI